MATTHRGQRVNLYTLVNGQPVPWDGVITFANSSIQIGPYSSIVSGSKDLPTAGTRVQFSSTTVPCKLVMVSCPTANTSPIFVGDVTVTATNGTEILPGTIVPFPVDNLTDLYAVGQTNGDDVIFNYYV